MKAALIAIGTEVTSGQIANGHALFFSKELTQIGYDVLFHITVDDTRTRILSALNFLESEIDIMVITGGLGPTSDDITRDVLAEWLKEPLVFEAHAWDHITRVLETKGRTPRDIHRKQAYFPKGATILANMLGTAHGFRIETRGKKIIVLPGPPREIESIWSHGLERQLREWVPTKKTFLFTWLCEGRGESEFAELTEHHLKDSGLRIGYRLIYPKVEIKVWVDREHLESCHVHLEALTQALKPWTLERAGPL